MLVFLTYFIGDKAIKELQEINCNVKDIQANLEANGEKETKLERLFERLISTLRINHKDLKNNSDTIVRELNYASSRMDIPLSHVGKI